MTIGRCRAAALLVVLSSACGAGGEPRVGELTATPDPTSLAAARACAPSGWTAEGYQPGSADVGLGPQGSPGRIRVFRPETVSGMRGRSKPGPTGVRFATDWWTVTEHDERSITFADGRVGKQ
jgi:hypothetical protein